VPLHHGPAPFRHSSIHIPTANSTFSHETRPGLSAFPKVRHGPRLRLISRFPEATPAPRGESHRPRHLCQFKRAPVWRHVLDRPRQELVPYFCLHLAAGRPTRPVSGAHVEFPSHAVIPWATTCSSFPLRSSLGDVHARVHRLRDGHVRSLVFLGPIHPRSWGNSRCNQLGPGSRATQRSRSGRVQTVSTLKGKFMAARSLHRTEAFFNIPRPGPAPKPSISHAYVPPAIHPVHVLSNLDCWLTPQPSQICSVETNPAIPPAVDLLLPLHLVTAVAWP